MLNPNPIVPLLVWSESTPTFSTRVAQPWDCFINSFQQAAGITRQQEHAAFISETTTATDIEKQASAQLIPTDLQRTRFSVTK